MTENIVIEPCALEDFLKYYKVYYASKYADYYFRKSQEDIKEKLEYQNCCQLIKRSSKVIGGVLLKANYLADLFVVPPFNDYELLAKIVTDELIKISDSSKPIDGQEIIEVHVPTFEKLGFKTTQTGHWMIRHTETLKTYLHPNYEAFSVSKEAVNEIAEVILTAYKANKSFDKVGNLAEYIDHVNYFLDKWQHNNILNEGSKVIKEKESGKVVGVCLHMVFEQLPLIMSIAVLPTHQGYGLGKYLLNNSVNSHTKGFDAVRLYVYKENPALSLYEKVGFIKNKTLNDMVYKGKV